MKAARALGPGAYGAFFTIGVPAGLIVWARVSAANVPLPVIELPWLGALLVAGGVALIVAGMRDLRRHGRGLPMNAYPPPEYVRLGVYGWTPHPIYVGFGMVVAGVAIGVGSASGLWLVAPATVLGMVALVLGYERHDLRARFGPSTIHRPRLSLPEPGEERPTIWDRASVYALVIVPWMIAYEGVFRLGVPPDAIEAYFAFEGSMPVLVWTEGFYASVYLLVGLAPLIAPTTGVLRRFSMAGLLATVVVTLIYLCVPLVAPPRPFEGGGMFGAMLRLERAMSHTVAAFPSFHVLWTLIAAEAWTRSVPRGRRLVWLWAAAITVSCITTGMHALVDVVLALALWPLFRSYDHVWALLRHGAERVANSWREWRVGPVRIINHGFYAGLAGTVGLWAAATLAGPEGRSGVVIIFFGGLLGAGLWAQRLEGSSELSRPFGYSGSVVGSVGGGLVLLAAGQPALPSLAATAAVAPWIQAIGRMRCLVQGCCHGTPCATHHGIEYRHPSSRVVGLAGLAHRPLHPTPLYSILANVVIGVLAMRMWHLGAGLFFIGGTYMLLAGTARFVEESFRGEPQTPVVAGLRLYQWTALIMVVAGIVMTSLPSPAAPTPSGWTDPGNVAFALLFGLIVAFAMGVDFPESNRRFARLSG